jgi:hypothetical protein
MVDLPDEYVDFRRQRCALIGEELPEMLEITEGILLDKSLRDLEDERYNYANMAFPGFERITFDSAASFADRAECFLNRPEERKTLVEEIQAAVHELFTYDALVKRIKPFLTKRLNAMAK